MNQGWRRYQYARLVDFKDGDTCEVEVDHGFSLNHRVAIRLYGISCPELTGADKILGQDALRVARAIAWDQSAGAELLLAGVPCMIWTWKASFNRYVGRVLLGGTVDVARAIIQAGYGHAWDGKTERRQFDAFPLRAPALEEVSAYDRMIARDFNP